MPEKLTATNWLVSKGSTMMFVLAVTLVAWSAIAPAVKMFVPELVGWTVNESVSTAPTDNVPRLKTMTLLEKVKDGVAGETPINPTPAGRVLLKTTLLAVFEPVLVTDTV